ncbi:MAG: ABC-F family ATP-binding cassette domain-containing protein [Candidatus Omnitrophica bacterium]|nr:ABC-F family ATP-binding cassette domain-containing protein [Candidatus Omnitrophota bacterium]
MPVLLQVNQIHKSYGATVILDSATASFSSDQKIGMIGRNGAGKSTLCRIITGHETADSGTLSANSELRLSYLEQHDTFEPEESVLHFLMRTTGAEHWQCGETAARFQIKNEMLDLPVRSLPGGYQTRVKLTAMLLREPNFLVLDEPSNYLDLRTLILLENFLLNFRGGYLLVSHDREFLKRTCDHTLEIESGTLTLYPGNIEEYFEFKEIQQARKEAQNKTIQKKRDQLEEFISRFRAKASTASRAQSKMKQLERLKTIEIAHQLSTVNLRIPQVERKAGIAFSCDDFAIGYPEKMVASGIRFEVHRGRHVAILGDNGQGKTTFLKTIAGQLAPKAGSFRWGSGIRIAYYAQHVSLSLDQEDTVYAHLARADQEGVTNQEILAMAGCFLFRGEDVKKKVKVLSGGERARLVLAGLLLSKSHALLLDEPTNHLDFETVEALGRAIKKFHGTVFFIGHDRTFVNLIATDILELNNGKAKRYPGTYEDYVYHLEMVAKGKENESDAPAPDQSESEGGRKKTVVEEAPKKEKPNPEISKCDQLMKKIERRISHYTQERNKLLEEMRKNPLHYSKERNMRLKELQANMEEAETEWCSLQEKLDRIKSSRHA